MNPDAYLEMAETEARHWWFAGRRANLAAILSRLKLPADSVLLEVGSGTGGNLDMLSAFGQVRAVEMDDTARKIARNKTGGRYEIMAGSCPDNLPVDAASCDLVCLFDVLEHIEDDAGTLVTLKRLLKPGGYLVIMVPAHPWLYGPHDVFLHHKRRYRAAELRQKLTSAGFRIERFSYLNMILFPLAVAARLKDRLTRATQATGAAIPPRPINNLLRVIFSSEKHLIPHFSLPFGVSLLAVARAE